jgi:hypothetical protein
VPAPPPTAVPEVVAEAVEETAAADAETLTVPAEAG